MTGRPVAAAGGPTAALLQTATSGYQSYVDRRGRATSWPEPASSSTALRAGNLQKAKELFGPTRIHYEAIEPVAESFGDARSRDRRARQRRRRHGRTGPAFTASSRSCGCRARPTGTGVYATKLLADVTTLYHRVQTLTYQPAQLANGAVELLNEVASSKITGEEDRYSHTDLSDFQGNLTGARTAFELLAPGARRTRAARRSCIRSSSASPPSRTDPRPLHAARRRSASRSTGSSRRPTACSSRSRSTRWPSRSRRSPPRCRDRRAPEARPGPDPPAAAAGDGGRRDRPGGAAARRLRDRRRERRRTTARRATCPFHGDRTRRGIATPPQDRLDVRRVRSHARDAPLSCATCCATGSDAAAPG